MILKNTKMENVEKKEESRSYKELRDDLLNEATKLVSEIPSTRIAIFVTPPPSETNGFIHSFAHPSAESVVQTFLHDESPVSEADDDDDDEEHEEEEDKGFWWEDEKLYDSMNAEELEAAQESLARLKNKLILHLEAKKRGQCSGNQKDLHEDKYGPKP